MNTMSRLSASVVLAFAATTADASTIETLLSIPGVPGDSTIPGYRDWIDLDSVSVGVVDRACSRITLTKQLDRASPALSASALAGVVYPSMMIAAVQSDQGLTEFLTYTLTNVVVTAVNVNSQAGAYPVESITLQPGVITMSYRPQRSDGTLDPPIQYTLTCGRYK